MVGVPALLQQPVVFPAGVFADIEFGDSVGQIVGVVRAGVGFNDGDPAAGLGVDQRARVRGAGHFPSGGEIDDVDHAAVGVCGDVDAHAVAEESGVEGHKPVLVRRGDGAEQDFAQPPLGVDGIGQSGDNHRLGMAAFGGYRNAQVGGEAGGKDAVHQDDVMPVAAPGRAGEQSGGAEAGGVHRQRRLRHGESGAGHGRDVGVLPGFVAPPRGGQAEALEGVPAAPPQAGHGQGRAQRGLGGVGGGVVGVGVRGGRGSSCGGGSSHSVCSVVGGVMALCRCCWRKPAGGCGWRSQYSIRSM